MHMNGCICLGIRLSTAASPSIISSPPDAKFELGRIFVCVDAYCYVQNYLGSQILEVS